MVAPMTMHVDLVELLSRRPIRHPTQVESVVIRGDRMEMVVTGHPWWASTQADMPQSRITLVFEELSKGTLPVCLNDPFNEDLESFSIQPLATIEWAQPPRNEIYCQAPLPDPAPQ